MYRASCTDPGEPAPVMETGEHYVAVPERRPARLPSWGPGSSVVPAWILPRPVVLPACPAIPEPTAADATGFSGP